MILAWIDTHEMLVMVAMVVAGLLFLGVSIVVGEVVKAVYRK